MKNILCTLLLTATLASAQDDYLNFIMQIQGNPIGTTHKIDDIDPNGNATALEGVYDSSVFQLWTIHTITAAEYMLDEKTVSSYHPTATINITSLDPYQAIPRTRIDSPFSVNYSVSGIVTNDPDAQDAAKSVIFDHRIITYADGAYSAPADADYETHDHDPITQNGDHSVDNIISQLRYPGDVTTSRGEEIFSIYANPDFGVVGASLLASQRVHIWPIANGSFTGVDPNRKYAVPPTVTISCTDLYPESDTYIRYFKTSDPTNPNTSGIIANYNPRSSTPKSHGWTTDLNEHISQDGVYTLRLEHGTVFNTLDFGSIQLTVKRSIKVNGSVSDSE